MLLPTVVTIVTYLNARPYLKLVWYLNEEWGLMLKQMLLEVGM